MSVVVSTLVDANVDDEVPENHTEGIVIMNWTGVVVT